MCNIISLDSHLTYSTRKTFLSSFKPLTSVGDVVPQPADLSNFWSAIKLGLRAIDASVIADHLGHLAIEMVGLLILGPSAWALLTKPDGVTNSWEGKGIVPMYA